MPAIVALDALPAHAMRCLARCLEDGSNTLSQDIAAVTLVCDLGDLRFAQR
jgi:hypothetical protein